MMKTITYLVLLFIPLTSIAQPVDVTSMPLKVGDYFPKVTITNIINQPEKVIEASDYEGKMLLLDFWATSCGTCLRGLPKLDSIHQVYKSKIQVVAVTSEDKRYVDKFLQTTANSKLKNLTLPIATNDKVLAKFFPHKFIPHIVWISSNGKILAITDDSEVTIENINDALSGMVSLREKKDLTIDLKKPMLMGAIDPNLIDLKYSSSFSGYTPGIGSSNGVKILPGYKKIFATNGSIQTLYKIAYGESRGNSYFRHLSRTLLEVSDSTSLLYLWPGKQSVSQDQFSKLKQKSVFNYELIVPASISDKEMFKMMQQDLNRFYGPLFGIKGQLEKREITCLVVEKLPNLNVPETKGGRPSIKWNALGLHAKNKSLDDILQDLSVFSWQRKPYPVVNETNIDYNIDIDLNANLSNIDAVKRELNKWGLNIVKAKRNIDMIIISDIDTKRASSF